MNVPKRWTELVETALAWGAWRTESPFASSLTKPDG
jgi:hypothetical protein